MPFQNADGSQPILSVRRAQTGQFQYDYRETVNYDYIDVHGKYEGIGLAGICGM